MTENTIAAAATSTEITSTVEAAAEGRKDNRPSSAKTALPGRRGNFVWVAASDLVMITDKSHKLYDARVEEPLADEFVASIDGEGVKVPVFVAKLPEGNVVVAGKQRLRAVRVVNERRAAEGRPLLEVPSIAIRGDASYLFGIMVLENECRREDSNLGKADKTKRFLDLACGGSFEAAKPAKQKEAKTEASYVFGVTTKTVEGRLKLLATAPAVQAAVASGAIGWWAASEFAGLPVEQQEKALAEVIGEAAATGKKPTVEGAKRKAGKGQAAKRAAKAEALAALKDAAEAYGSAKADKDGVASAKDALLAAAEAFYAVISKPAASEDEADAEEDDGSALEAARDAVEAPWGADAQ